MTATKLGTSVVETHNIEIHGAHSASTILQHTQTQENNMNFKSSTPTIIAALRKLADTIESNDGVGYATISEAADRLEELETQCNFLLNEYGDICDLVKFKSGEHDSLTNAVAIALDEQKKYTALSAIDYLQSMISGVFCNDTKIVIFDTESPEIIISTDTDELRYEIPTGSESETDQFIESLAWISGQLIEDSS